MVFPATRVVVFVDGDFWHGRDWPSLRARLEKRANPDYWIPKIARNLERDAEQTAVLVAAGWRVLRFWETDILADVASAASTVAAAVRGQPLTADREDHEPASEAARPRHRDR